jgi:phosphoglycerate dehydrogenase-like enzyme
MNGPTMRDPAESPPAAVASHRQVLYLGPEGFTRLIQDEVGSEYKVSWAPPDAGAIATKIGDAAIWFDASMKVPLDAGLLNGAPKLELVITATTGSDHISLSALEARGIPLMTLQGQMEFLKELTPAAELSWLLLLACARRLRAAVHHVEAGGWDRELFPGQMLNGKTLGIIGCGRIGGWMARYGRAFGMTVLGYDPLLPTLPETISPRSLDGLLRESDFITVHVPFNETTRGLLSARELALLRDGAVLINTSRGAVVDEDALIESMEAGRPAALGVDVLDGEPDVQNSKLWRYARVHENVLITPHIGGFSPDALERVLRFTARRVREYFRARSAS